MNLSRLFKTIFLLEFISGLYIAVKELFKKSTEYDLDMSPNDVIENTIRNNINIWNYLSKGMNLEIKILKLKK